VVSVHEVGVRTLLDSHKYAEVRDVDQYELRAMESNTYIGNNPNGQISSNQATISNSMRTTDLRSEHNVSLFIHTAISTCGLPLEAKFVQGKAKNRGRSLERLGVPTPVTGSHPVVAVKPAVPQPWFPPVVMSLKPLAKSAE